ncbi:MAG TPA: Nramp family divalent metal transporter [Candidatus Hydrogenedentes bacterium]|mgnify:CR=1 FL=1|nr:Nramp family divalent metal transporter [Candidatus Hydrogenedentota bacterium]HRK33934.1 Nramp family divalent metal transporter [Candidatus Hydrogenedentota bacterium]
MGAATDATKGIRTPPRGIALIMALGPGLVWCGEYIGSGEVLLATRAGAIFGFAVLWVPVLAIFSKYWIGLAGAHYTVTTGEGMIDMMARTPGPKNWVIWPVFIGQLLAGATSTAALAGLTGKLATYFLPNISPVLIGWIAVLLVISVVWSGKFEPLKQAMSLLVLLIIIGATVVAVRTWPGTANVLTGLFGFQIPQPPDWAVEKALSTKAPWMEILPLLGWAAGGFASQVWYTYWVMGAGYGMTGEGEVGRPADTERLRNITKEEANALLGWRRVVTFDATLALTIGIVVTSMFLLAGNGILRPAQIVPGGENVALDLARIFGEHWGRWGANLFILAALAAMISTMIGQFGGWPRLLADCGRVLFPGTTRWPWKLRFRVILLSIAATNMGIIYSIGKQPEFLVQMSAILDGLLLTPLQAIAVGMTLYFVFPKMLNDEVRPMLRAHKVFIFGLALAFVVYTTFCVFKLIEMAGLV